MIEVWFHIPDWLLTIHRFFVLLIVALVVGDLVLKEFF